MSKVSGFSNVGIESISFNQTQVGQDRLPKKSLGPLGVVQPSYLDRIFRLRATDAQIVEGLSYKVRNEDMLTPANFQNVIEELRDIADASAAKHKEEPTHEKAFHLLNEMLGNMRTTNLNRQIQSSS